MVAKELHFDGREMIIRDKELPEPTASQALIRAEYSNISIGTEMEFIRQAQKNRRPAPPLGYSLVGVVEAAGPGASVKVGQRVLALTPHASAAVVDAGALTPVPTKLDTVQATLGTILSIALHIVQRANPRLGESVIVFGCGLVGALVTQVLKHTGVRSTAVVEPDESRRTLAKSLGADAVLLPSECQSLGKLGFGEGFDIAIEVAASGSAFPAALNVLRTGGRLICTSTFLDGLDVPLYPAILDKELSVIGAHQPKCPPLPVPYYPHSQSQNRAWGLELMAKGSLKVKELITHRLPWHKAPEFYSRLSSDRSILGAVIDWTSAT